MLDGRPGFEEIAADEGCSSGLNATAAGRRKPAPHAVAPALQA